MMKRACITTLVLLLLGICALCMMLFFEHRQSIALQTEITSLREENSTLKHKLTSLPMTAAEEEQYIKNKEMILSIYTFGDVAVDVSELIHEYCRLGIIPNGQVSFAEKRTWKDTSDSESYGLYGSAGIVDLTGLYFQTMDGNEYCVVLSDLKVTALVRGSSLDGEVLYLECQ